MLSYASAYKMCVPTLSKLLNATARSRRAGPRACRLPDQLAWETLPGSAREGVSSYIRSSPRHEEKSGKCETHNGCDCAQLPCCFMSSSHTTHVVLVLRA